jgi:hypothetical protein
LCGEQSAASTSCSTQVGSNSCTIACTKGGSQTAAVGKIVNSCATGGSEVCGNPGQQCCTGGTCNNSSHCCDPSTLKCLAIGDKCASDGNSCVYGSCAPCGATGDSCCPRSDGCTDPGACCDGSKCISEGTLCKQTYPNHQICRAGSCANCGGIFQMCCPVGKKCDPFFSYCNGSSCEECGDYNQPCCAGTTPCRQNFSKLVCRSGICKL